MKVRTFLSSVLLFVVLLTNVSAQKKKEGTRSCSFTGRPGGSETIYGGRIPVNTFKAQQAVRADLRDFVFEGDKLDITGFTLIGTGSGFEDGLIASPNPGAYFNENSRMIIERSKGGTTIIFDEIKAKGSDGSTRNLPTIVLNLF